MSFKDRLMGSKKGTQCVQNEDGSISCRRFRKDGNEELTDGSELSFGVDPNSCQLIHTGPRKVMDEDQEWARSIEKDAVESCRRGLA